MGTLNERQCQVLEAVVKHYTKTGEPLSSNRLVTAYGLGVSSATVRTCMADLERAGYLDQPHTSAGRIPTERAYRHYVNRLLHTDRFVTPIDGDDTAVSRLNDRMLCAFSEISASDHDALFNATCQLLAQLSSYIGVVISSAMEECRLRRLALVTIGTSRILAVLIMDTGAVRQRQLTRPAHSSAADLRAIARLLNDRLAGKTLREIQEFAKEAGKLAELLAGSHRVSAMDIARDAFAGEYGAEIYWDGIRNLPRQSDFTDVPRTTAFLRTLESREELAAIIDDGAVAAARQGRVRVRIGSEIRANGLDEFSLVTAGYALSTNVFGVLGVIGPMRMRYPQVIPLVELTARLMARQHERLGA